MTIGVPSPAEIRASREAAGLTQRQAAELVYLGSAMRWSEHERGVNAIDLARWELWLLKAGQHPTLRVRPIKLALASSAPAQP